MEVKYIDIVLEAGDEKDAVERIIHAIHKFNALRRIDLRDGSFTYPLAWSLPRFQEAQISEAGKLLALPQCGSMIRVFGSPDLLREYAGANIVAKLSRLGAAQVSEPQSIPNDAGAERFCRDRSLERMQPNNARARREKQREIERAGSYEYRPTKKEIQTAVVRFEMTSESNKEKSPVFLLDVRRSPGMEIQAWFSKTSSYGLCIGQSSVPKF